MTVHGDHGTMEVLQIPAELDRMRALYLERKPKRVLEIGCWDGGTLREWLTNGVPEIVVAVDLEHRNSGAYEGWRDPSTTLVLHHGMSQAADAIAVMQQHAPYDWVFIDGDHGDQCVAADAETCEPLVAPGGLMVFHDIEGDSNYVGEYGPRKVLERLRESREVWEYVDPGPSPVAHGIGVVQL